MRLFNLIHNLNQQTEQRLGEPMVAPMIPNQPIRLQTAGLWLSLKAKPHRFEGWGLFAHENQQNVHLLRRAELGEIERFLKPLPALRVILLEQRQGSTWSAMALNPNRQQKFQVGQVFLVHLVRHAQAFDTVWVRWDGLRFWFETEDWQADPVPAQQLRERLFSDPNSNIEKPQGISPWYWSAFLMVTKKSITHSRPAIEQRLQFALNLAGARLVHYQEKEDSLQVTWSIDRGETHTCVIDPNDFKVLSAGFCLSGEDHKFDLESLVGVFKNKPDNPY